MIGISRSFQIKDVCIKSVSFPLNRFESDPFAGLDGEKVYRRA